MQTSPGNKDTQQQDAKNDLPVSTPPPTSPKPGGDDSAEKQSGDDSPSAPDENKHMKKPAKLPPRLFIYVWLASRYWPEERVTEIYWELLTYDGENHDMRSYYDLLLGLVIKELVRRGLNKNLATDFLHNELLDALNCIYRDRRGHSEDNEKKGYNPEKGCSGNPFFNWLAGRVTEKIKGIDPDKKPPKGGSLPLSPPSSPIPVPISPQRNLATLYHDTLRDLPADVRDALNKNGLTHEQKIAVVLHYCAGVSYGEMADQLGGNEGTWKKRAYDGLQKLRN